MNRATGTPEGQRFAVALYADGTKNSKPVTHVTVLLNFFEECCGGGPRGHARWEGTESSGLSRAELPHDCEKQAYRPLASALGARTVRSGCVATAFTEQRVGRKFRSHRRITCKPQS
jgi:hypothetical protein